MGFRLQAVPSVPVPDVAAVITVDEQALGGGPGLAHRVHLPESEFVAAMEGLSLAPATTVNASVEQAEPPPPPPTLPPAAKAGHL